MTSGHGSRGRGVTLRALALTYLPAIALLAVTGGVSAVHGLDPALFTRDPAATFRANPITGLQSNVGILVWFLGAAITLFAGAVLPSGIEQRRWKSFFYWSGAITLALTLDDFFQIHEEVAPRYAGLNDKVVVGTYGLALLAHLLINRRTIAETEYRLLGAALVLFAMENGIDFFQDEWRSRWRIFVEDGFKLLGIVTWTSYHVQTAFGVVRRR